MKRLRSVGRRTFSALSIPNFRRYFYGQSTSLIGTWMQSVAQSWLVYTLTHSSTALGFVIALQTLPVLILGPYGGVIADRVDKRRLMIVLQSIMGVQALVLGLLAVTHVVRFWEICVLAVILGLNNTFENPARQSFVREMVGGEEVRNAVSLNSTMVNAARAVGPAVAGLLIATVGVGVCFLVNAVSFVAVVYSLTSMDKGALRPSEPTGRQKGQLREGFRYVAKEPRLGVPLLMMAIVGMLAYEFQVTLPVVARQTFHGGAATYGLLTAAMGAGAVLGGLVTATRGRTGLRPLTIAGAMFGVMILFASVSPVLAAEFVALAAVGWTSVTFLATGNSTLQLQAEPSMRGRVMALWSVAFLGSTPVGGPLIGWIVAVASARVGLAVGAGLVPCGGRHRAVRDVEARHARKPGGGTGREGRGKGAARSAWRAAPAAEASGLSVVTTGRYHARSRTGPELSEVRYELAQQTYPVQDPHGGGRADNDGGEHRLGGRWPGAGGGSARSCSRAHLQHAAPSGRPAPSSTSSTSSSTTPTSRGPTRTSPLTSSRCPPSTTSWRATAPCSPTTTPLSSPTPPTTSSHP